MSSKNLVDLRRRDSHPPEPAPEPSRAPDRPASARRISSVRTRRRRTRLVIAFIFFIVFGTAAYTVSWASYLPRYSVSTVDVIGAKDIPNKLIYDYVETQLYNGTHPFLSKDNIFLYNPKALEREIAGFFPRIASVSVSRDSMLATAVTVSVKERQPFALWCSDTAETDCYHMDAGGFIYAQAQTSPPVVTVVTATSSASSTVSTDSGAALAFFALQSLGYVFEGGLGSSTDSTSSPSGVKKIFSPIGQTFVGAHVGGIVALLKALEQAGFAPIGATVEDDQDFFVPLSQGFYIKVSFGEDPDSITRNLHLILTSDALSGKETQLEYVDLRFGDRVYYKLQGSAETQNPPATKQ